MTCGLLWYLITTPPFQAQGHVTHLITEEEFCRTLLTSFHWEIKRLLHPRYTVKSTPPRPVGHGHHHQDSHDLTVPHLPFFLHFFLLYEDSIIMWLNTLKSRNGYTFILIIFLFPISPSSCSPPVRQPLFPLTYPFREGGTDKHAPRAPFSHLLHQKLVKSTHCLPCLLKLHLTYTHKIYMFTVYLYTFYLYEY